MTRPIHAVFDLAAFRQNLAVAKARAPRARVWVVIKANAYGHGLLRAAKALAAADGYALLEFADAVALRDAGCTAPILLLEGVFGADELDTAAALGLSIVVHCDEQLALLGAIKARPAVSVLLKINSGMNRLGFAPAQCRTMFERLTRLPAVSDVTLMTHFADADGPEGVAEQLGRFEAGAAGIDAPRTFANSAALLRYPESHAGWVRPGIMLYGCSPFPDESADALGLKPVMTLKSELIAVRSLAVGDRVGYGGVFTADRPMRIGVAACGYGDGYPRHAPSGTPVLVNGRRTRLLGRPSMDMLTVDLEGMPEAAVGTPVTLWGHGLSCDDVAAAAGTISYELVCRLATRVPQIETPD